LIDIVRFQPPKSVHRHPKLHAARHHRQLRWIDAKFVHQTRIYLGQDLLAGLALLGILVAEDTLTNGAIIAAIASSVAIVFFVTHSVASHPFRLVGGNIAAIPAALCTVGLMFFSARRCCGNRVRPCAVGAVELGDLHRYSVGDLRYSADCSVPSIA